MPCELLVGPGFSPSTAVRARWTCALRTRRILFDDHRRRVVITPTFTSGCAQQVFPERRSAVVRQNLGGETRWALFFGGGGGGGTTSQPKFS